jgi:thiamine pyrophosphokinase
MMHALIIANGTLPNPDFVRALTKYANIIVCADGGANHAQSLNIKPHIILGDFDSIHTSVREHFREVEQLLIQDQNNTDLEKAILYCIDRNITSVDIVGAAGDRLDHTTGSLGCIKKYGSTIHIRMIDTLGEVSLIRNEIHCTMRKGEKISLIPLDRCTGITTTNLKYALNNDTLELGIREGISNEATSQQVSIRVETGTLLLYRFHGLPWLSPPGKHSS